MLVGRVTGSVVSTNKCDSLRGAKLLIVQPVDLETLQMKDDYVTSARAKAIWCSAHTEAQRANPTPPKRLRPISASMALWIPSICAARAPTTRQRRS